MTIVDIVTLLIAAGGLYIAVKKAPIESRKIEGDATKTNSDTAAKWQEIASRAADREQALNARLDLLEAQVEKLEQQAKEAVAKAAKFEDWARRLSAQVISLNGVPVPFDPGEARE